MAGVVEDDALRAIDSLFADDNLAVDGTFTAPPAPGLPVRVILARHDAAVDFAGMQTQVRAAGWEAHVRQSDVPTLPRVGIDTLTVTASTRVGNSTNVGRPGWSASPW